MCGQIPHADARTAPPTRPQALGVLALVSFAGLWLTLRLQAWPDTPDGFFHLQRVRALVQAWEQGVLFPRWFPDFAFGYGHPILHYYAPAYYPVAGFFHWLGLDLFAANALALGGFFALSGLACYALLRCYTRHWPALVGTALFLAFPYRHYDLFVRGALPEFAAFLWPPLILYGYARLLGYLQSTTTTAAREKAAASLWIGLTGLAWAGLILTHNLTALMAGSVWAVLATLLTAKTLRRARKHDHARRYLVQTITGLTAPLLLGGLLSSFYVVPVLLEAGWVAIGADAGAAGYANHAAAWNQLWSPDLLYTYPAAAAPTVNLPAYVALLAGGGLLLTVTPWAKALRLPLLLSTLTTLGALWFTTQASLPLWDVAAPILGKLQFPWRWHTVIALSSALSAGFVLQIVATRIATPRRRTGLRLLALAVVAYAAIYGVARLPRSPVTYAAADVTAARMWDFDFESGQIGATWTGEFLPRWVDAPRWTIGRAPEDSPADAPPLERLDRLESTENGPTVRPVYLGHLQRVYAVETPTALTLTLPHFYFPAWHATLGGADVPLYPATELGWMALDVPAGEHIVHIAWRATRAVWLGRLGFGLGWLLLGMLLWHSRDMLGPWRRRLCAASWTVLLAAALVAMTNPGATSAANLRSPQALDLDYGHVYLSAAELPPGEQIALTPGQPQFIEVTLHWTLRDAPAPLHAFVHLVRAANPAENSTAAPVAQFDTRIGGEYLPAARYRPGLPLTSRHLLSLPPDLPPGEYRLRAGVYFSGAADVPLPVLNAPSAPDPRPEIGRIRITTGGKVLP